MLYWKVTMEKELIFNKLGYQILVRLVSDLDSILASHHAGTGNRGNGRGGSPQPWILGLLLSIHSPWQWVHFLWCNVEERWGSWLVLERFKWPILLNFINCCAALNRDNILKVTLLVALLQPQASSVPRLDPEGRCENESIEVFDGRSTAGPLLGKVCSENDFVPVFESSSNSLTFQIVTDPTSVQRSVFISYYFFSPDVCKLSLAHPFHSTLQGRVPPVPAGDIVLLSPPWRKGSSPVLCTGVTDSVATFENLILCFWGKTRCFLSNWSPLERQICLCRQLQVGKHCAWAQRRETV